MRKRRVTRQSKTQVCLIVRACMYCVSSPRRKASNPRSALKPLASEPEPKSRNRCVAERKGQGTAAACR